MCRRLADVRDESQEKNPNSSKTCGQILIATTTQFVGLYDLAIGSSQGQNSVLERKRISDDKIATNSDNCFELSYCKSTTLPSRQT